MPLIMPCRHDDRNSLWIYFLGGETADHSIQWCPICGAVQEVWDGHKRPWQLPQLAQLHPVRVS